MYKESNFTENLVGNKDKSFQKLRQDQIPSQVRMKAIVVKVRSLMHLTSTMKWINFEISNKIMETALSFGFLVMGVTATHACRRS